MVKKASTSKHYTTKQGWSQDFRMMVLPLLPMGCQCHKAKITGVIHGKTARSIRSKKKKIIGVL
jgi:hypothetical protein